MGCFSPSARAKGVFWCIYVGWAELQAAALQRLMSHWRLSGAWHLQALELLLTKRPSTIVAVLETKDSRLRVSRHLNLQLGGIARVPPDVQAAATTSTGVSATCTARRSAT
jgi:hypothetical protein